MKKVILSLAITLIAFTSSNAQKPAYEKAMKALVSEITNSNVVENSYLPMANKMERIAAAEPNEWIPKYWVAYCYSAESYRKSETAGKDQVLEIAEKYLAEAQALSADNDELEVLKAQIAAGRLTVDPMNRWQKYGEIFSSSLAKAEKINANNPRVAYLRGTNLFYTPENFGGGKAQAKKQFEIALEKFSTFKPLSEISPNWGLMETNYYISQCK